MTTLDKLIADDLAALAADNRRQLRTVDDTLRAMHASRACDTVGVSNVAGPPADESTVAPLAATKRDARGSSKSRHIILFLAANPSGTTRLDLDGECAAIERELRMTAHRNDFELRSKWAVSVDEMMRHFNELQPTIIHFSGHGAGSRRVAARSPSMYRDGVQPGDPGDGGSGIYLQDEHGGPQFVTARTLRKMIKSAAASARVVVLNACFSDAQADAVRSVVDCVVGMSGAIRDDAARSFAVGFYRALGNRRSVGNAVEQAVATITAKQLPDEHLPCCRTRDGIDPHHLVLGGPAQRPHHERHARGTRRAPSGWTPR